MQTGWKDRLNALLNTLQRPPPLRGGLALAGDGTTAGGPPRPTARRPFPPGFLVELAELAGRALLFALAVFGLLHLLGLAARP